MARLGIKKSFYFSNDTAFKTIRWFDDTGRFIPIGIINNLASFKVENLRNSELQFIHSNWGDMKFDSANIAGEVPATAINSLVPIGMPGDYLPVGEGEDPIRAKWVETHVTIVKYDDPTKALVYLGEGDRGDPDPIKWNTSVAGITTTVTKDFIDLVLGIAGHTIANLHCGEDIAAIRAAYLPPSEEI